jgi:isopenicillin N synthase-like dioxygenase
LQRAGFLLVAGHGVDPALRAEVRAAARRFFALPDEVKQCYAVRIGGRGWLGPGVEANALVEGTESPPDLKESFAVGPDTPTGDQDVDAVWFPPNVWPAEVPPLTEVGTPPEGQYRIGSHTDFGTVTSWTGSRGPAGCRCS